MFDDCVSCIKDSIVSDIVCVDYEDRDKLGFETIRVEAGLLISDTVPISDIEIEISGKNVVPIEARIVVYPEFSDHFNEVKGEEAFVLALVMTLSAKRDEKQVLVPVFANTTGELVVLGSMYWLVDKEGRDISSHHKLSSEDVVHTLTSECLRWWYFIQTSLTNPPIRDRFASYGYLEARQRKSTGNKKKRNPVKYVKVHIYDPERLGIIKKSESGRTYTCLAWYVIGHWREYKNGRKVFIKPYWKGTMRNSVGEAGDVSRNRVVAQIGEAIV